VMSGPRRIARNRKGRGGPLALRLPDFPHPNTLSRPLASPCPKQLGKEDVALPMKVRHELAGFQRITPVFASGAHLCLPAMASRGEDADLDRGGGVA